MGTLVHDLKVALRSLRKSPGFTAAVLLSLALGLGANIAIFSAVDGVLLRPLPYADGDRLVMMYSTFTSRGIDVSGSALPDYRAVRDEAKSFTGVAAAYTDDKNLVTGDTLADRARTGVITPNALAVLGLAPSVGRAFTAEEGTFGRHRVALLSPALYEQRFNHDPRVLGRTLRLDGEAYTIVGVAPKGLAFPSPDLDVYIPLSFAPGDDLDSRGNHFVEIVARLAPGATVASAQAEVTQIFDRIAVADKMNEGVGGKVIALREHLAGKSRAGLLVLLGAVGMVLLIACANLANLLLARSTARRRELGVRAALGASRGRLVRQLLTESVVLALVGGGLGLLAAAWLLDAILSLAPDSIRHMHDISVDGRVAAFAVALSALTGVAFGLLPALSATRVSLAETLHEGARGSSASGGRLRRALIVAEVAISFVLIVGAGLLLRSFAQLRGVGLGFDPERVMTAYVPLPLNRYPDMPAKARFVHEVVERLRQLPGVRAAAAGTSLPMDQNGWGKLVTVEERPAARREDVPIVQYREIEGEYFEALGMRAVSGRLLGRGDVAGAPVVTVINETAARQLFPGEDPLGKKIFMTAPEPLMPPAYLARFPGGRVPRATVVGVVADTRTRGPGAPPLAEVFQTYAQAADGGGAAAILVRTEGAPELLGNAMRAAVAAVDPDQAVMELKPMTAYVGSAVAQARFHTWLLGAFALVATLLALVGVYGVMAYTVGQRRRELGIRLALGATRRSILRLVFGWGAAWVAAGLALGLAGALAMTRVMKGLLYGISALDPVAFVGAIALLAAAAALALLGPARRAAGVDPMVSLREE